MSHKGFILGLSAIVILVFFSGCSSQQSVSSVTPTQIQTEISKTLQTTAIPTITKESYSPQFSRGDLLLITDPTDRAEETSFSNTIKAISGINLEGKNIGKLIINLTWEDPIWPGQARYNYYLMYESSPGVWSKVSRVNSHARKLDMFKYTLLKHFPNADIDEIESVTV